MSVFAEQKLRRRDISAPLEDAETVVNNAKVVAIYFSAHWCPPCKAFTPVLKWFYEEASEDLVIIFVSSDADAESMDKYFKDYHGDYYAVPYENTTLSKALKKACQVSGIPSFSVVNKKGQMVIQEGRSDVQNTVKGSSKETVKKWLSILKDVQ